MSATSPAAPYAFYADSLENLADQLATGQLAGPDLALVKQIVADRDLNAAEDFLLCPGRRPSQAK